MNVNFETSIKSLYGKPVEGQDGEPIRLGSLCVNALMGVYEDEKDLSGEEKVRRSLLAESLIKGVRGDTVTYKKVNIDSEDVVLLKKLANKMFPSPTLYTPIVRLLEGKTERKLTKEEISNNGTVEEEEEESDNEQLFGVVSNKRNDDQLLVIIPFVFKTPYTPFNRFQ